MLTGTQQIVTKLTTASINRRIGCYFLFMATMLNASNVLAQDAAHAWQPIEEIASAAEQFLMLSTRNTGKDKVATAGYLDPRLTLPRCTLPLEPFLRPGSKLSGRVIVGVRCNGDQTWKVYLPVHLGVIDDVVVAARPLPRGHLIEPGDLETTSRDVSGLVGGYHSTARELLGQRLTRNVARGVVLSPTLVKDRTLVSRGQRVTLSVIGESIDIRMAGVAVSDGSKDQLIRVKNSGSGKIVEGRVRSPGTVEVMLN